MMKRTRHFTFSLLLGGLSFLVCLGPAWAETAPEVPAVTVAGQGKVSVKPDLAIIVVGAEQQAATAVAAQEKVAGIMSEVAAALEKKGVAKENLRTTMISVFPLYESDVRLSARAPGEGAAVIGFRASSRLEARSSDLRNVGALIDASMDAGANRIEGLRFSLANDAEPYRDALWAAVEDARSKAETIAKAAGVKLLEPVSIAEGGGAGIPPGTRDMAVAAFSGDTTVEPGLLTIQAQVEMRFRLEVKDR